MFGLKKNKTAACREPRFERMPRGRKGLGRVVKSLSLGLFSLFLFEFFIFSAVFAAEKVTDPVNFPVDLTSVDEKKAQTWAEKTATPAAEATPTAPQEAPQETAVPSKAEKAEVLRHSLVRLPMLPNRAIESRFLENKRPKSEKKEAEAAKKPQKPDPEAYAAFSAYKKKQLEALESDRQTLQALQEAIHDLGLSQKLSFSGGNITAGKNADSPKQSPPKK